MPTSYPVINQVTSDLYIDSFTASHSYPARGNLPRLMLFETGHRVPSDVSPDSLQRISTALAIGPVHPG